MWETIRLFFTDFKNTPLKDRIFALMSLFMFLIVAVSLSIIIYQNTVINSVKSERDSALSKLDNCRETILKDNKDYSRAITDAVREANARCETKVDNLQTSYNRELESKALRMEEDLKKANRQLDRLKAKIGI